MEPDSRIADNNISRIGPGVISGFLRIRVKLHRKTCLRKEKKWILPEPVPQGEFFEHLGKAGSKGVNGINADIVIGRFIEKEVET